ncbi:rhomboidserine protease family protein [Haloferula helveola]|uniref:Rhomboidserine protease family protein n=1 Tax=Haloferula helveola TaxID=490095 RepID=A0ABN6H1U9_9BACT|nr:rhomboidserine protease family protein [Haloferula helveola]
MGINDRDYTRNDARRRAMPPMPVVTKWLLILNLGIFVLDLLMRTPTNPGGLVPFGAFRVATGIFHGHIWEFLSFQFLHASLGHVAFNCLGIFVFAPHVERWWGTRRFLAYYLLCGAAGAVFYAILLGIGLLPSATIYTPLVGASAGVFGLLFAIYQLAPAVRVRLLIPPVELTIRQLALALAGLAMLIILGGLIFPEAKIFWNSGGEAGHLGGALMGLLLMKAPQLLGKKSEIDRKVVRPKQFRRRRVQDAKVRPRTTVDLDQESEVDRILDKVRDEGVGSLTAEERRILEEMAKRK